MTPNRKGSIVDADQTVPVRKSNGLTLARSRQLRTGRTPICPPSSRRPPPRRGTAALESRASDVEVFGWRVVRAIAIVRDHLAGNDRSRHAGPAWLRSGGGRLTSWPPPARPWLREHVRGGGDVADFVHERVSVWSVVVHEAANSAASGPSPTVMNSGRESGVYVPPLTASLDGAHTALAPVDFRPP